VLDWDDYGRDRRRCELRGRGLVDVPAFRIGMVREERRRGRDTTHGRNITACLELVRVVPSLPLFSSLAVFFPSLHVPVYPLALCL
jgi:hypothetical protein